jgi:hypothetical protein
MSYFEIWIWIQTSLKLIMRGAVKPLSSHLISAHGEPALESMR